MSVNIKPHNSESSEKETNEIVKNGQLTKRKSLSIDEKIELFEKYIDENENDINTNTVYEGYPIGIMLNLVRHEIRKGSDTNKYSTKQIEKLTDMGLLEDKRETIEKRADRLEKFCKNHGIDWINSRNISDDKLEEKMDIHGVDEQERKDIINQLKLARRDYEYIYQRKVRGKLSDAYTERLRQAGVGRAFGYKDEIENLGNQYEKKLRSNREYSEDEIQDKVSHIKEYMQYTDMLFGGLDKLRHAFIEALINRDTNQMSKIMTRKERDFFITQFDVSSPDFTNHSGLGDLVSKVIGEDKNDFEDYGLHEMRVFDSQEFKDRVLSTLTDTEQEILDLRYGLTDGNRTHTKDIGIRLNLNCTDNRISQYERKAMKKLNHPSRKKRIINMGIDSDREEQFIRKFFEHHDIFSFSDSDGLDDKVKSELLEIYNDGIKEKETKKEEEEYKKSVSKTEAGNHSVGIEELDLSDRSFICLKRAGINTVEDLLSKSEEEIRKMRNLGKKSADEVMKKIAGIKKTTENKKVEDEKQLKNSEELKEVVTNDLESLSLEELENMYSSNNSTIENNEKIKKQVLINKILKQQEIIAAQEKEISELKRKRDAHEQQ